MSGLLSRGIVVVAVLLACVIGLTAAFGLLVAADYFAFATILSPPFAALAAAGTGGLILKESTHVHAEGMSSAAFRASGF